MKKPFRSVLFINVAITIVSIVIALISTTGDNAPLSFTAAIPMLLVSFANVALGVIIGIAAIGRPKLRPYIFPLLICGLLLFLVGFSFCTASFTMQNRDPTIDTVVPASAH